MKNGIFKLDLASVADAVLTAIVMSVLATVLGIVSTSGFDVFSANWTMIGHLVTNVAVVSGVTSLAKDLLSTNTGSLLNIGPSTTQG